MTADAKECNGGCEGQKVEFQGKVGLGAVLEGDRKRKEDYNGIACREGEESGGSGSEGSDDPAERDLDPGEKVFPVDAEESGGPPANVGSLLEDVAFGDREASGEKGGDRKEGVDSVVNSENGVEDRKDETAVSDSAEEETMESKTNTVAVAEAEESKGKEIMCRGVLEDNNGVANNELELEERKEEIVAIETELRVEPEYLAEVQEKSETTMTETDDQIRTEFTVKVEEGQEPETVVTETDHQGKLDVGAETKDQLESGSLEVEEKLEYMAASIETDHQAESKSEAENVVAESKHQLKLTSSVEVHKQDALTANRSTHDQVEAKLSVVVETQEPQIVLRERNDQEQSEVLVRKEDKQEPMTLVSETKDQAELQSAEVELKEVTEVAGDQDEPEAVVRVGEEQKPESVVTETPASESLPLEHEKARLSNEAEEGPPDECSAENAASSEPQCETSFQKADSSESAESHEASITSRLDGMVKEAESSGDQEFLKEVKVSTKSAENGETSPTETETDIHSADGPGPSGPVGGADVESEIINASINSVVEVENVLVQSKESMAVCSNNYTGLDSKVCNEVEIENHAVAMESDSRIRNDSAESGEYLASSVEGDQATRKDDDEEPISEEVEAVKVIQAPPEDPSGSALDGERVDIQGVKRQPCYIIRVPRFTNDELWAQIQHAKLELEEKTRSRDSTRVSVQKKKATCNDFREKLETAKGKEKAVRAAYNAKRQEIESVQSMLNKIKNATSIEEIDNKIEAMDREFQHSTMGLKEEKQHLLNIKQLRQRREQLSSNMGPKSEIDMAFDQRDQIEERFKTLKKELDSLKADLSEAEIKGKEAWKDYDDEVRHLKDLQEQFRTADEIRQKAYGHWRNLKDESFKKSKYFYMYKSDQEAAAKYLSSGDRKGLWLHCSKQVEKIMELWNNNDEFRMQYVKSNKNSTLRRLKTLDGRSLGPDEEPPAPRATVDKSSSSVSNSSNANPPVTVIASEAKPEKLDLLSAPKEKESFPPLQTAQTIQSSKSKKSTKPTSKETVMAPVSDREEVEAAPKENSRTKEEEEQARKMEELARKEEELRKEKAEAEMKEQLRLEQKAKAKEAEERKRRKAEKAQARAECRAQKEFELREKKKLKKEKKKAAATSNTTNGGAGDHAPTPATDSCPPENAREPDNQSATASKRPSRPLVAAKQYNKISPVPLPLRNRGKRKMRTWMWLALATLPVLAWFFSRNYRAFSFSL
ncbi:cingulin [Phoenix dactylifera]|uniref:Cingulin n=1 Tax=Phoenix dactylifera TaxID=42345 RepID=A0A8B7CH71_PHODC|nr:cingulin [Phoenix dactylifera]